MFDAIDPGTTAVSPEGDAIAVYNGESWVVVDPYAKHVESLSDSDIEGWTVKYSPTAVRK